MASEKEIYEIGMTGFQSALEQEALNYREAMRSGDTSEAVRAWQSMGQIKAAAKEAHEIAVQDVQSRQYVKQNPHGLTDSEMEIARAAIPNDSRFNLPKLSDEQKAGIYKEQKDKLHRMRASGEYRQTTDQTG